MGRQMEHSQQRKINERNEVACRNRLCYARRLIDVPTMSTCIAELRKALQEAPNNQGWVWMKRRGNEWIWLFETAKSSEWMAVLPARGHTPRIRLLCLRFGLLAATDSRWSYGNCATLNSQNRRWKNWIADALDEPAQHGCHWECRIGRTTGQSSQHCRCILKMDKNICKDILSLAISAEIKQNTIEKWSSSFVFEEYLQAEIIIMPLPSICFALFIFFCIDVLILFALLLSSLEATAFDKQI